VALWRRTGSAFRPRGRDSAARIASECRRLPDLLLAAVAGDRLVGAVIGSHDGRRGWINRLAVDPAWRRRGVARRLVRRVEAALHRRGIHVLCALVEEGNRPSRALFRSLGYTHHRRIRYYSRRRLPCD